MIVVVLVVIWVVALTPFLLRRLSEHQIASSAARFRAATGLLRRIYPRSVPIASSSFAEAQPSNDVDPRREAERRRREHSRIRRQQARRKAILFRLLAFTGASLVLGALPHLHELWVLSLAGFVLTACYVGALYFLAQGSTDLPAMSSRPLPPVRPYTEEGERIVASGGGGPFIIGAVPRRPAFRLVDPNS